MYEQAVAIDSDFKAARDRLLSVEESLRERDYQRAMSGALAAMGLNDVGRARRLLEAAQELRPGAAEVRDLARRLKLADEVNDLNRLSQQASLLMGQEKWQDAVEVYARALKIDATALFALDGLKRAKRLVKLTRQVDQFLSNPESLESPETMERARGVVEIAMATSENWPRLREQTDKLNRLLEQYSKPVPVLLHSDDMTDIVIYRVARLGHFLERRMLLTVGRYTVVGTRSGYRDVRIELVVPLGSEGVALSVQCEEQV